MIPIQNIYYMLSYAFSILKEQGYKDMATEEYLDAKELFAEILIRGVSIQIKRGLRKDYRLESSVSSLVRGKINITESLKSNTLMHQRLSCSFDEFTEDSEMNRILKTTMTLLFHAGLSSVRRREIRKLLVFFQNVRIVDIHQINWNQQYNRSNQTYHMLISMCYLVVKGLLQTQADGSVRLMDFLDEQRMCRLYEKFLLEYFRKEYPSLKVDSSQIQWQLDDDESTMLPKMQTDITISDGVKTLIVDAKYYQKTTDLHFSRRIFHTSNIYQIFTYVKNKEMSLQGVEHEVSGMLLYAKTDEDPIPEPTYSMSGNKITVKTLDLGCSFAGIRRQLDEIITLSYPKTALSCTALKKKEFSKPL